MMFIRLKYGGLIQRGKILPYQGFQVGRQRSGRKRIDCFFLVKRQNLPVRANRAQLGRRFRQARFSSALSRPDPAAYMRFLPGAAQQMRGVDSIRAAATHSRSPSAGAQTGRRAGGTACAAGPIAAGSAGISARVGARGSRTWRAARSLTIH